MGATGRVEVEQLIANDSIEELMESLTEGGQLPLQGDRKEASSGTKEKNDAAGTSTNTAQSSRQAKTSHAKCTICSRMFDLREMLPLIKAMLIQKTTEIKNCPLRAKVLVDRNLEFDLGNLPFTLLNEWYLLFNQVAGKSMMQLFCTYGD